MQQTNGTSDDLAKPAVANAAAQAIVKAPSDEYSLDKGNLENVSSQPATLAASANSSTAAATPNTNKLLGAPAYTPTQPSQSNGLFLAPTQAMDCHLRLLGDRLMRLLSTIGEPDSTRGSYLEFLRFYPSATYVDKETETLLLEYTIHVLQGYSQE
jgi:hypothetical protein